MSVHVVLKRIKQAFVAGLYMLKVNDRNTRTRCEMCGMAPLTSF